MEQNRRLQLHVKCIATAVLDFNLSSKRENDGLSAHLCMTNLSANISIHKEREAIDGIVIAIEDINQDSIGEFLSILTNH